MNTNKDVKPYIKYLKAYTSNMAFLMRKHGFEIIGEEPNRKNPRYSVYLFDNTPEARITMQNIIDTGELRRLKELKYLKPNEMKE